MNPHYEDQGIRIIHGDCIEVMRALPDSSVHAVVTDPPYGLEFMGKDWDAPWKASSVGRGVKVAEQRAAEMTEAGKGHTTSAGPYLAARVDSVRVAGLPFQRWCEEWATEALRVLKPGGHMLAFGGSRTWHRLAVAVEDAGFEIRDSIAWLYGSGFPKSRNLDGDWQGWGTALKPAFEPIVVGRKPLVGTVAGTVERHGTGALNIGGCRVEPTGGSKGRSGEASQGRRYAETGGTNFAATPGVRGGAPEGRWPTNVLLDGSQADELDKHSGILTSGANPTSRGSDKVRNAYGEFKGQRDIEPARGADSGGASRFFPTFRYEAKAPAEERPNVDGVQHPTVKPLDLMRWLVRLVTPPGGTVLEPFAGSGTTVEACLREGFACIAIEREETYLPLILRRIRKPHEQSLFGDWEDAS